ncbi:MAG: hypothetical protein K2O34_01450, partial [Acetatifactor sp.]|nr:hypothetical protein [Acetatifactor sp.]
KIFDKRKAGFMRPAINFSFIELSNSRMRFLNNKKLDLTFLPNDVMIKSDVVSDKGVGSNGTN